MEGGVEGKEGKGYILELSITLKKNRETNALTNSFPAVYVIGCECRIFSRC